MALTFLELQKAYQGKRVLVTGHTGFKGSWLVYWLKMLGADVAGYSHDPNTDPSLFRAARLGTLCSVDMRGNIEDCLCVKEFVKSVKPDIVFHLAAQPIVRLSYEDPWNTFNTNVMGSVNVLEAVREYDDQVAVVMVTSDKCYNNREWVYGYRENEPMGGVDPYSASKGVVELIVSSYQQSFFEKNDRVLVASARAGNVIGGGDWAQDRIIPDIVRALSQHEMPVIRNPEAIRPWQHVLEALSGYLWLGSKLLLVDRNFVGGWNFGPEPQSARTVREVANCIGGLWGQKIIMPEKKVPGPHEAKYLMLSIEKSQRAGWSPRWDFNTAIKNTISWYKAFYADGSAEGLQSLMHSQIMDYSWTR
jgi:CDP-glucose 4,6-dehydratase